MLGVVATGWGVWPGLLLGVLIAGWGLRRPLRRWRLAQQAFPPSWCHWLERHVPFYRRLGAEERVLFERDIQFFLDDQRFEAVAAVEISDELRLGVAAGAALLLHGRPDWEWPTSRTILFYPSGFDDTYHESEYADYDGMVHAQGPIILAVDAVEESWAHPDDGSNVVLHELAHLFDFQQAETAAGLPSLLDSGSTAAWQQLVRREMARIRRRRSLLRGYAATGPEEFFAVAVENFFERPRALRRRHEELYAALVEVFQLDPAQGMEPEDGAVVEPTE